MGDGLVLAPTACPATMSLSSLGQDHGDFAGSHSALFTSCVTTPLRQCREKRSPVFRPHSPLRLSGCTRSEAAVRACLLCTTAVSGALQGVGVESHSRLTEDLGTTHTSHTSTTLMTPITSSPPPPSLSLTLSLCPGIDRLPVTSPSPGSCLRLSLSNRTTFVGCLLEGVERLPAVLCPQSNICHSMQSPDPRPRARSHLSIFLSPLLAGCSSRQHQISHSHQLNAMFLSSTVCRWQRCSIPRTPGRTVRVDSTPTSACPRGW